MHKDLKHENFLFPFSHEDAFVKSTDQTQDSLVMEIHSNSKFWGKSVSLSLNGTRVISHYKKTARILREKIVGISSEYRYSDDIPTKQVVGNNSSEFLLSSEIPRNFPTEFRGNKLPRKFRGPLVCRKCPRNIPRANFVGIFPRTFIDRCVLDIYTSIDRNIPTDIFLGIYRGTCPSEEVFRSKKRGEAQARVTFWLEQPLLTIVVGSKMVGDCRSHVCAITTMHKTLTLGA
ncbi:hypothetical protein F2Q68_00008508 [Brassica cretica]|uniref:Uncharacterized protein n=1 Tax=Brassica cretica TaxID=69181 RepID=A0A8S9KVJ3_BRACR|nr:hypothetical protein F2Q68_00008508 [Brassica cretica]